MNVYNSDIQTFDEWWKTLPDLSAFSSKEAQRDRDALEVELLDMANITSLLGKRRKTFTRDVYPNIELSVDKWGGVVRRMTGNGLGRFSDANADEWLAFVQMETWAMFRGEVDSHVSHSLKAVALLSRVAMKSILEQQPTSTPHQICTETAGLFDAIGRETKFDLGGPDAVFEVPSVSFQFAIDERGDARLLEDQFDHDPEPTSFLKTVSPTPTIVPIGNGGLIVEKASFELPLPADAHRDLLGTQWVAQNDFTADMQRVVSAWVERLNDRRLWVPEYDPDTMKHLTLEQLP